MNITVTVDLVFDRQHRQDGTYFIEKDSVLYLVILGCACSTRTEISVVTACSLTWSKRQGLVTKIEYHIAKTAVRAVDFWNQSYLQDWQPTILDCCTCGNTQFELIPTGHIYCPQPGVKVVITRSNNESPL